MNFRCGPVRSAIENATGLLGQTAIPLILILLGITLASIHLKSVLQLIGTSVLFKLVAFPVLAFILLLMIFSPDALEAKVLLMAVATLTAATTTLLAIKFGMNPDMVSSAMFVSMLASLITIPILLVVLKE